MGTTYGPNTIGTVGHSLSCFINPEYRVAGVTLDWDTVTPAAAPVTWNDGMVVEAGEKALRYGQVLTRITASGRFGPYDPTAVDGRAALARGDAVILDRSIRESDPASNHPPGCAEGGLAWKARIIMTTGAHSLAAGPTVAEAETVFPRLRYAQ